MQALEAAVACSPMVFCLLPPEAASDDPDSGFEVSTGSAVMEFYHVRNLVKQVSVDSSSQEAYKTLSETHYQIKPQC